MFTGLLPSEHHTHFQHLGYDGAIPTVAERLAAAGHTTEIVTRNSIFDWSIPGVTRGFQRNALVLSPKGRLSHLPGIFLARSKARFRRQIRSSGFLHGLEREKRDFVMRFARAMLPADWELLEFLHERLRALRRTGRP